MRHRYPTSLIALTVIRRIIEEPKEGVEIKKHKIKKVTRLIEYFDKYDISKLEPMIHHQTFKKLKTRCMIFYKPNNTYYEIDEPLNQVYKKINDMTDEDEDNQIGFKYKNRNK